MSDEHTPTTEQVEDGFAHDPDSEYRNPVGYGAEVAANRRAFRSWLAVHDREVAAKALEDAAEFLGKGQVDGIPGIALPRVREWLRAYAADIRGEES